MLSSATLFHFTRSLEILKKILAEGFKPFYCSEDLTMFGVAECPGIPMASFCDIPLSHARRHVDDYGRYAIGLDKKWGMSKNIAPVHYIYEGSMCARVIFDVYHSLPKEAFEVDCTCMKFNTRTAIFFYGKPYRGHLRRKDTTSEKVVEKGEVTFYDEREWRYVPFADQTKATEEVPAGVRAMLSEREYAKPEILDEASTSLHNHYRLTFGAEDVKYLIVENEDEIPELVDFIYSVQADCENRELRSCPENDKKRLTTRVISMRQIEQDF
jgi:abortive phage resistance protein AbiGi (putative antitoxin)